VQVTGVKLERSKTGLDIVLETAEGKPLQVDATKFRAEGNRLIAEIPNAVLALPEGQAFSAENPTADIASVQVVQQDPNKIRVRVIGTNALPKTEVTLKTGGLAYSLNPAADELDVEIVVTGDRPRVPTPFLANQLNRADILQRNNIRLGDALQRLPGVGLGGPPGENNEVRLLGIDKEFTRVQLNGITLPDPGEKRELQVNCVPAFLVNNVRVIKNRTAEFESDGLAGLVQVNTLPIPDRFSFQGRAGYGGYSGLNNLYDLQLAIGDRPDPTFGYLGGFNYLQNPLVISKNSIDSTNKVETERENKNQTYYDFLGNIGIFYEGGQVNIKPLVLTFVEDKDKFKLTEKPSTKSNLEYELELKRVQTIGTSITNSHNFGNGVVLDSEIGYYSTTEDKDKTKLAFEQQAIGSPNFVPRPGSAEVENKRDAIALLKTALVVPIAGDIRQELKVGASIRFRDRFRNKTTFNRSITGAYSPQNPIAVGKKTTAFVRTI
jgi:hypothetical protein